MPIVSVDTCQRHGGARQRSNYLQHGAARASARQATGARKERRKARMEDSYGQLVFYYRVGSESDVRQKATLGRLQKLLFWRFQKASSVRQWHVGLGGVVGTSLNNNNTLLASTMKKTSNLCATATGWRMPHSIIFYPNLSCKWTNPTTLYIYICTHYKLYIYINIICV